MKKNNKKTSVTRIHGSAKESNKAPPELTVEFTNKSPVGFLDTLMGGMFGSVARASGASYLMDFQTEFAQNGLLTGLLFATVVPILTASRKEEHVLQNPDFYKAYIGSVLGPAAIVFTMSLGTMATAKKLRRSAYCFKN